MKNIILSILTLLLNLSAFAFEGEITIRYKGDISKKEDYTVTFHIGNGKTRTDFLLESTNVTTVFLPQGGNNVQLYVLGGNNYFNSTITDIPSVEEYKTTETLETKTISGQVCTKFIFQSFSGKTVESWIAKNIDVDWNSIPNTLRMLPEVRIMAKYGIKGAPLETVINDNGNIASKSNIISIKAIPQSAETFIVPSNYTLFDPKTLK